MTDGLATINIDRLNHAVSNAVNMVHSATKGQSTTPTLSLASPVTSVPVSSTHTTSSQLTLTGFTNSQGCAVTKAISSDTKTSTSMQPCLLLQPTTPVKVPLQSVTHTRSPAAAGTGAITTSNAKTMSIQTIQLPVVHTVAAGAQILHTAMEPAPILPGHSNTATQPSVSLTNFGSSMLSTIASPPDLLAAATQAAVPHLATRQFYPQNLPIVCTTNSQTFGSIVPPEGAITRASQSPVVLQAISVVSSPAVASRSARHFSQLLAKGPVLSSGTVIPLQKLTSLSPSCCPTLPPAGGHMLPAPGPIVASSTGGSANLPAATSALVKKANRSIAISADFTEANLQFPLNSGSEVSPGVCGNEVEETGSVAVLRHSSYTSPTNGAGKTSVLISGHFCVDCNRTHAEPCMSHAVGHMEILDSPVLPRARVTLPPQLTLRPEHGHIGVYTKEQIPKWTRVGPVVGKLRPQTENEVVVETAHTWRIFKSDGKCDILDCSEEDESNWMRFLRRARVTGEQTLVAYQQNSDIYMMTCCNVLPNTELLYWYSTDYATLIGQPPRPEDWFSCGVCGEQFDDLRGVKQHIKYIHPDMTSRKWKCTTCSRAFTSAVKLNTHMMCHAGVRPHRCQDCGKTFTDQSNLRMHLSIHTGERKFKCTLCSRAFRQKAHLASHLMTHTGEKKMKCRYCTKMFARKSDVKSHEYQHTKERMFTCHVTGCSKVFYKVPNLKKHLKIHNGVRDFACDGCKRKFVTKYHMQRHLKVCRGTRREAAMVGDQLDSTPVAGGSQTTSTDQFSASTNELQYQSQISTNVSTVQTQPTGGYPS